LRAVQGKRYYATLPRNIRRAVYSGGSVDGVEGMTVSLWADDAAMIAAVYRPGYHRTQMDDQKETGGFFDFSSFTRARILASTGTWDGSVRIVRRDGGLVSIGRRLGCGRVGCAVDQRNG